MRNAGAIFVSHSTGQMRKFCKHGVVLENGQMTYFEDVEEAIERHLHN